MPTVVPWGFVVAGVWLGVVAGGLVLGSGPPGPDVDAVEVGDREARGLPYVDE